jgi:hypothetical protein
LKLPLRGSFPRLSKGLYLKRFSSDYTTGPAATGILNFSSTEAGVDLSI